ncbi:MAG: hypothetical protein CML97_05770 [Rhodobiaceae bacterium]|nr:hypothetical protein [Rhodobiaceae bacterium]|tara:strand:- start:105 stop:488 length:384 start_codon:yes stop_codon:yes gene_type:complete
MEIERTMLWAGLLAILFIYLAFQTALERTKVNTAVGEGEGDLLKKSRVVGNLAEHAPLMLLMMMMLENDGSEAFVTILGLLFFLARLAHVYGVLYKEGLGPQENPARAAGAIGSWALMGLAALACIF